MRSSDCGTRLLVAVVAAVVLSTLAAAPAAAASGPTNAFVADVREQFEALSRRPDGLAFDIGGSPDANKCQHYQGIARVQAPDGTPYLYVTHAGVVPAACGGSIFDNAPGNLLVIRMGSRDRDGERLRSNRLFRNEPPHGDPRDVVTRTIRFDGGASWPDYRASSGWPAYGHPGGMQAVGDVLAVGMEEPYGGAYGAAVAFLDVSVPAIPRFLSVLRLFDAPVDSFSAGTVGLASIKAEDGTCCRYLLVVTGKDNRQLRFYRSLPDAGSTTTDLRSSSLAWEQIKRYTETQIEAAGCLGTDWPVGGDSHQSLNFVREGNLDGSLFIVGARNDVPGGLGDDDLDLLLVDDGLLDLSGAAPPACPFRRVRAAHMSSFPYGGFGSATNFAAGSGTYVSPSGELIVYGTEYENTGPLKWNPAAGDFTGDDEERTAPVAEFRHRDKVRPDSPTLHPTASIAGPFAADEGSSVLLTGTGEQAITKAWLQFYDETGAGTSFPDGGWQTVDYADRAENFDDLAAMAITGFGFAELASSWRWFAPEGCTISANNYPIHSPDFPGPGSLLLRGTGARVVATSLGAFDNTLEGVTFFHLDSAGNRIEDCDAYYGAPIGLQWDLDHDGSFEVDGTSATFSAAALDGPTTGTVAARAQHPTDTTPLGTGIPVSVPVEVRNVAPRVGDPALTTGSHAIGAGTPAFAGLPLRLDVTFTDPGLADTQTAVVDWGDGTVDTAFDTFAGASGGAVGRLQHSHTFAAAGTFEVAVTVADDDGGATRVAVVVEVLSLDSIAEDLRELVAANAGTQLAIKLGQAVAKLDDAARKFREGNVKEALAKLEGVVRELEALVDTGLLAPTVGDPFLVDLARFADLVSEGAIAAAEAHGASAAKVADAQAANARGDALRSAGSYTEAVSEYKHAASKVE